MLTAEIKRKIVTEAKRHEKLDAFVQGAYEQRNGVVKHCSIGCVRASLGLNADIGEHGKLVDPTGVPEFILRMSDNIFEGLPEAESKTWTRRLWSAIPEGCDLSHVADQFSAWCLLDRKHGLAQVGSTEEIRAIAKATGELYVRRSSGKKVSDDDWKKVERQAEAAWRQAEAAWRQAEAAWRQAEAAWRQAEAAWQQAEAAWQQAEAAWRQAGAARRQADAARQQADAYAAWQDFWIAASKELIRLVSLCRKPAGRKVKG